MGSSFRIKGTSFSSLQVAPVAIISRSELLRFTLSRVASYCVSTPTGLSRVASYCVWHFDKVSTKSVRIRNYYPVLRAID
jgi:hypothetical protein